MICRYIYVFNYPPSPPPPGFIFIYSILSITYWWFVHVCSTFWKVMFPFHARSHEKTTKYLHVIILIVGIILPIITPLVAYFSEGYIQSRFPPLLCIPRKGDVSYYGLVLPVCIVLGIGITFIVIVLHVLHQVSTATTIIHVWVHVL